MNRYYYSDTIKKFCEASSNEILGILYKIDEFKPEQTQKQAWLRQIELLKEILPSYEGMIYFEFSIPRMGRRIDVVLIIKNVIYLLEFKVGEKEYLQSGYDQVWDYALDLKNFHETSEKHLIVPVLIATEAPACVFELTTTIQNDNVLFPIKSNCEGLGLIIDSALTFSEGEIIDAKNWSEGRYSPTPTIIEAAISLFNNHSVEDISRKDAAAINLKKTSKSISEIIKCAKDNNEKVICFVTGVPGAGKTLVGLNIASQNLNSKTRTTSVFLSGNGPLVAILREALTRDKVRREKQKGIKKTKADALREVKLLIQNVHHYRDEYLADKLNPPTDHIAIFDEAQRAWDLAQTANFMAQKKKHPNFSQSEPEFLISCLDRHDDWAVIVCLVGGGQEINTGEAGISEWIDSINRSFPKWHVHISSKLHDTEYAAGKAIEKLKSRKDVYQKDELHLSVSMRSFRAEHLSHLVKSILDLNFQDAIKNYELIKKRYPIVLTRDLSLAKEWLKTKARGSERYGIIVSAQAKRLKPHAIDIKSKINPIHWFLDGKDDIRSSYYLEDVATEFQVQGLELDWACVTWDADFRYSKRGWKCKSFAGTKWKNIKKIERQQYLKNAYRVLLTRSRQGMVIVVPHGDKNDATRLPEFYDETFNYLKEIGFNILQ
jgi:DUF2075 family protein